MTDIITRLRDFAMAAANGEAVDLHALANDAAAEIERLRAALEEIVRYLANAKPVAARKAARAALKEPK